MSEWRPIHTAPRDDGKRVLGCIGRHVSVTYYSDLMKAWRDESEVTDDGYGWSGHDTWEPTHWMPLPAPPK